MAETKNVKWSEFTLYDSLIKNYINTADAKSIKSIVLDGTKLKFYKVESPTGETPVDYEIELPDADVSNLLGKLATTTAGNIVITKADGTIEDSTIALTTLASKDELTEVSNKIGTLANLDTTIKTDLVSAINEVRDAIDAGGTGSQVTMDTTTTTEGYLKSYTIKQGDNVVGIIDIPKDLVVTAGEVVVNPEGQSEGTYVKLTIANQTTPVYINVKDLVDVYTAQASATQIQLAISETNEISATIVAGSITSTELAANAVTTVKIADANVTLAKLATDVTDAITNAETKAKQYADSLNTAMDTRVKALEESVGNITYATEADIRGLFT